MTLQPTISIICGLAETNNAIGHKNQLLWHIPEDFKNFKKVTSGHPIIMGQKTFESIGKPLPNRTNIILTTDKSFQANNCTITYSIPEAINIAKSLDSKEIFIIGGGQIYAQCMNLANKLYLTLVEGEFEADTFFPDYSQFTNIIKEEQHDNGKNKFKFLEILK